MWPFNSREKDLKELAQINSPEFRWSVVETTYGDSPLIVRINTSAKEWLGHKALGIKLGFAVPLNAPKDGGLPDPDENQQLNELEDIILEEVGAIAKGIYALVLTTGVMREFVFFIAGGADIGVIHEAVRKRVTTHEVQCMAVKDLKWDAYTAFAES